MKTKTSILTALVALASGTGVMAQVYSQNVVGYVNVDVTPGFNLIANPLVSGSNAIGEVLPNAPEGAVLYTLKGDGSFNLDLFTGGAWYDFETEEVSATQLAPGKGFFLYSGVADTLTFVGEVQAGAASIPLNSGFSLVSSVVPQSYELVSPDFPAADGMVHYAMEGGNYIVSVYSSVFGWFDQDSEELRSVSTEPGKGFFIFNPGAPLTWERNFQLN